MGDHLGRAAPWVALWAAAVLAADIATVAAMASVAGPAPAGLPAAQHEQRDTGLRAAQHEEPDTGLRAAQHEQRDTGLRAAQHEQRDARPVVGAPPLIRAVPVPRRLPYAQPDRLGAYRGVGAWVDVFDYAPAFQDPGEHAEVTPETVAAMAAAGVRTLYIQAARADPRSPDDIVDPALLGAFIQRAHAHGMRVVAWYLPTFIRPELDLDRLVAIHRFRAGGERVDGLAIDIEWVRGVRNSVERSRRLVHLSRRLRAAVGSEPLGAIVMPPVDTEVTNPRWWPGFPWRELAGVYDVWLPMSYWTNRSGAWRHAGRYTAENIRRLKAHLGASAPVHAIGGIGDLATAGDYRAFVRVARRSGAIGLSIYDWDTAHPLAWQLLGAGPRNPG